MSAAGDRDRRALLEAIAFGRDTSIRPTERLRAIELLDQMPTEVADPEFRDMLAALDGAEIQRELDEQVAAALAMADEDTLRERWPMTRDVIEWRVREQAEAKGRDLASIMYRDRAFTVIDDGLENSGGPTG
jgi:hypothetical protein